MSPQAHSFRWRCDKAQPHRCCYNSQTVSQQKRHLTTKWLAEALANDCTVSKRSPPDKTLAECGCAEEGPGGPLPMGPACPLPGGCSIENNAAFTGCLLPCTMELAFRFEFKPWSAKVLCRTSCLDEERVLQIPPQLFINEGAVLQ